MTTLPIPYPPPAPAPILKTPKEQVLEIKGILARMIDKLVVFSAQADPAFAEVRKFCGDLIVRFEQYLYAGIVGQAILNCFRSATDSGVDLNTLDGVLDQLFEEVPSDGGPKMVQQACIVYALTQEVRIVRVMEFESRDDVEVVIDRMRVQFDRAREIAADEIESASYEALILMAAALARYLADTARPLPRMVYYDISPWPALRVAQFIYGDGKRWEEIWKENKIIHPLFCPHELRALSD